MYIHINMLVKSSGSFPLSVLMVSPEYPPMPGGIGRYTKNLTRALKESGVEVNVACNSNGDGEFPIFSESGSDNSEILSDLVEKVQPDLVHIQYEPGLYGLKLDPLDPRGTSTNIDTFYEACGTPMVTTFHSAYTFSQWLNLVVPANKTSGSNWLLEGFEYVLGYWKRLVNYYAFHRLNKQKLARSKAGIVFSQYMCNMMGGCDVIPHGAQKKELSIKATKKDIRRKLSLPQEGRIALALGYATATKGWDIIEKMQVPDGWTIVMNASKNTYSNEKYDINLAKTGGNLIELRKDFLTEEELCLVFSSADAVILPYKVSSSSGVMFDALAYGLPFVATDLEFFKEFSDQQLGITVDRNPQAFSNALVSLDHEYEKYANVVERFGTKLSWKEVARRHLTLYNGIVAERKQTVIS
jgi:glycosyltransferase involved in cell wall biosynthesis